MCFKINETFTRILVWYIKQKKSWVSVVAFLLKIYAHPNILGMSAYGAIIRTNLPRPGVGNINICLFSVSWDRYRQSVHFVNSDHNFWQEVYFRTDWSAVLFLNWAISGHPSLQNFTKPRFVGRATEWITCLAELPHGYSRLCTVWSIRQYCRLYCRTVYIWVQRNLPVILIHFEAVFVDKAVYTPGIFHDTEKMFALIFACKNISDIAFLH